jgi:FixJ family two-component response regulator
MTAKFTDNLMAMGRPVVVLAAGDWAVVNALTFLLETEGCFVLAFTSGTAALARDLKNVACFVIDESLQGEMSASDLIAALKSDGIAAPILLMVTHPDGWAKEWAGAGVTIVEKPLLGQELSDAARAALTSRPT